MLMALGDMFFVEWTEPAVDVPTDHFHRFRPDLVRCPDGDDDLHGARFPTCGRRRHCRQRNSENQSFEGVHGLLHHGHRNYPWHDYTHNLSRNCHLAPFDDALVFVFNRRRTQSSRFHRSCQTSLSPGGRGSGKDVLSLIIEGTGEKKKNGIVDGSGCKAWCPRQLSPLSPTPSILNNKRQIVL